MQIEKNDHRSGNSNRQKKANWRLWEGLCHAAVGSILLAAFPVGGQTEAAPARVHVVQRGDSLSGLSRHYGVPIHTLAAANHLTTAGTLRVGTRLRIPDRRQKKTSETVPAMEAEPAASARKVGVPGRLISFNFSEVDVRQALTTISDYASTDIVVAPGGNEPISISLRNRTADEAIRLTAAAAGLSVAKAGGTYIVGKVEQVRKAIGEFGQAEMTPLHHATAQEAKDLLGRVAPLVNVEAAGNGVVISGLPEDMVTARAALRDLETNHPVAPLPKQETEIASLRFMEPALAERVLHDAFPTLRIVRQERTLILNARAETLAAAEAALKQMDVEPAATPKVSEALVYHLKYLNAQTAETSLKKVLPGLNIAVAPEPNAPPPALFQPLSTNTLSSGNGSGLGGASSGGFGSGGTAGGQSTGGNQSSTPGGSSATSQPLSRSVRLIIIGPSAEVQQAKDLLDQTDVAPPIVRIEAALVEVNRDNMKDLGMTWDFANTKFTFTVPGGNGFDFTQNVQRDLPRRDAATAPESNFTVAIQALITQNRARILANPNISVVDNEDANIFIGDLLRFPGATTTTQNATLQSIDTIPIGIALLVRPRIHPNGEVTLKVHPVVSSISGFNTVNGQQQPQTASREADTTVRLQTGQELVIGGLSRKELTHNLQKVPLLGDLPILGQFFQSRSQRTRETEILIFIRVYPVQTKPAPPDQSAVLPKDAPQRTDKSEPKTDKASPKKDM